MKSAASENRVRLKPIALPVEHGGWAFLGAPVLLGLWVAPSASGWWLSLAALGAFLTRQPFKLAYGDWSRHKRYPRTGWAERFAGSYALIAVTGLLLGLLNTDHAFWQPLTLAVPLVLVQLSFDLRKESRNLIAELCGVVGVGSIVSLIALARGIDLRGSLLLWLLVSLHSVPAVVYVATRLRIAHGTNAKRWPALALHGASLSLVVLLVLLGVLRSLVALAFTLLLVRCLFGFTSTALKAKPIRVGIEELIFSLLTIAGIALSF